MNDLEIMKSYCNKCKHKGKRWLEPLESLPKTQIKTQNSNKNPNEDAKDGLKDGAADLINRLADATEEKK